MAGLRIGGLRLRLYWLLAGCPGSWVVNLVVIICSLSLRQLLCCCMSCPASYPMQNEGSCIAIVIMSIYELTHFIYFGFS